MRSPRGDSPRRAARGRLCARPFARSRFASLSGSPRASREGAPPRQALAAMLEQAEMVGGGAAARVSAPSAAPHLQRAGLRERSRFAPQTAAAVPASPATTATPATQGKELLPPPPYATLSTAPWRRFPALAAAPDGRLVEVLLCVSASNLGVVCRRTARLLARFELPTITAWSYVAPLNAACVPGGAPRAGRQSARAGRQSARAHFRASWRCAPSLPSG